MSSEKVPLVQALASVHSRAPVIARHVIKARLGPPSARREHLQAAIDSARALLDELVTARAALGWQEREGDAA